MKKLTKILALVLSIVMVASCFVACSKDEKKDEPQTTPTTEVKKEKTKVDLPANDEDAVKQTLEAFVKAYKTGDMDNVKDYLDPKSGAYEQLKSMFDYENLAENFASAGGPDVSQEQIDDVVASIMNMIEFEIGDIKVNGDEATAEISIISPDFENVGNDPEIQQEVGLKVIEIYLEEKGMTMEELEADIAKNGQDAFQAELMEFLPQMLEITLDAIAQSETVSTDCVYNLIKVNGDWLISNAQ